MNAKRGFAIPLVIAIIAILIIGGGAYIYIRNNTEVTQSTADNTANTTVNSNTTTNSSKDWQTYKNSQFNFQVSIPREFTIQENKSYPASGDVLASFRHSTYDDWSFTIYGPYNNQTYNDIVANFSKIQKDFKQTTITIAGKNSQEFSYNRNGIEAVSIYIPTDGDSYIGIDWKASENVSGNNKVQNSKDQLNQILSTFKFVSVNTTTTSTSNISVTQPKTALNTKTYTSKKGGYTVMYPSNYCLDVRDLGTEYVIISTATEDCTRPELNGHTVLNISSNIQQQNITNLEQWRNYYRQTIQALGGKIISEEKTVVATEQALKVTVNEGESSIVFFHNGKFYLIALSSNPNEYKDIIASMKFTQ